ncbi:hypothetical protein FDECE_10389 [Fusarium decemcellulare]|nr:hypothetical protein FDECE_10389 [Fusarium decemcellulare]
MADQPTEKPEVAAAAADAQAAPATENKPAEPSPAEAKAAKADGEAAKGDKDDTKIAHVSAVALVLERVLLFRQIRADHIARSDSNETESSEKPAETKDATEKPKEDEKPAAEGNDTEMKDATEAPADSSAQAADGETATASAAAETPITKAKNNRRKSVGESKSKALNRKSSKARLTHLDAKPGDHFLVKLKGFPAWPAIICDESMLPQALVSSRPVTAARPDGTFTEAYADGGKRANDRSFPVMYLHTNEFGWVHNASLTSLSPEKARDTIAEKMRKDLKEAFTLASQDNPVEFYKDILKQFQEELIAQEEAKREAAATPRKSKKGKAKAVENDLDMEDVDDVVQEKTKSKKRKADDDVSTPQRSDSVKKPKIKLNTSTPKTANGTPKAKDESATKAKLKVKKSSEKKAEGAKEPKEPKLTPEQRRHRKEKEVLYLRHKLQRGLLTRDQQPQETEMKQMSDFVTMLENFKDLEVSIIRKTKINKVLKAILKLESIPREDEFHFKDRSQSLLEKWNKLMASDATSTGPADTNGVNGSDAKAEGKKEESPSAKEDTEEPTKEEPEKSKDGVEATPEASATEEKSEKEEASYLGDAYHDALS